MCDGKIAEGLLEAYHLRDNLHPLLSKPPHSHLRGSLEIDLRTGVEDVDQYLEDSLRHRIR
jgi:hypothetical protein